MWWAEGPEGAVPPPQASLDPSWDGRGAGAGRALLNSACSIPDTVPGMSSVRQSRTV